MDGTQLSDVLQDEFDNLVLSLAVHVDDKVVITSIIAIGTSVLGDVVIAHSVNLFNDGLSLLGRDVALADKTLDTLLH